MPTLGPFTGGDWSRNLVASSSITDTSALLVNNVGGQSANMIATGVTLPGKEGLVTAKLRSTGMADGIYLGIVDSALAKNTAGFLPSTATFCGVASDIYNQYLRIYVGGALVASLYFPNVPGGWSPSAANELTAVFRVSGGNMTVTAKRGQTVLLVGTGPAPAYANASAAFGAWTGGLAGAHTVIGPVSYASAILTGAVPDLSAKASNASVLLLTSGPGSDFATSWEYRRDGGAPVAFPAGQKYVVVTGLTNGTPSTFEVRGISSDSGSATDWSAPASATPTAGPGSVLLFDDFERADSTTTVGAPPMGSAWVAAARTFGILGGNAYTSAGSGNGLLVSDVGTPDHRVEVTVGQYAHDTGVVFRYVDTNNMWLFQYVTNPNKWVLYRCYNGTWNTLDAQLITGPTQVITIVARGEFVVVQTAGRSIWTSRDVWPQTGATKVGFRPGDGNARYASILATVPSPTEFDPPVTRVVDPVVTEIDQNIIAVVYKGRGTKALDAGSV